MQNRSRDGKAGCYYSMRNLCMEFGISYASYAGLFGTYPDEVAIALHPVIVGLQGFELDATTYRNMLEFTEGWNQGSNIKLRVTQGNILDATPNCRVNDLDFMGHLDSTYDNVLAYINRIELIGPVCVSLWNSYGNGITTKQHEGLLNQLKADVERTFDTLALNRYSYTDNHIPIANQVHIIQRRS
jgi:hypothetical protein